MILKFALLGSLVIAITSNVLAQKEATVDNFIRREMKERRIPGLQVAVVQHGKIVFSKSYGTSKGTCRK